MQNFCFVKTSLEKAGGGGGRGENTFKSHVSDKGLVSIIFKEVSILDAEKTKHFGKVWQFF